MKCVPMHIRIYKDLHSEKTYRMPKRVELVNLSKSTKMFLLSTKESEKNQINAASD